ncbi:MAG: DUF2807 domain-containing protein [Rikenellaceae bacterium]
MKFIQHAIVVLTLFFATYVSYGQNSNAPLLPASALKPFTSIRVNGDIELTLVKSDGGENYKIEYDLGDNSADKFKFSTKPSGELVVSLMRNSRSIDKVKATVYYNTINELNVSFASVKFASTYRQSIADIVLENGASLSGVVNCEDLDVTLFSDSRLNITGRSKYLTLRAQSSSKAELRDLNVISARVTSSQGAVVAISVKERLDVGTATKSVVKYWGAPTILRVRKSLIGGELIKQE